MNVSTGIHQVEDFAVRILHTKDRIAVTGHVFHICEISRLRTIQNGFFTGVPLNDGDIVLTMSIISIDKVRITIEDIAVHGEI